MADGIADQFSKLATPSLQVAAGAAALTALVAGVLISKASDQDIYEPTEKIKIKVEEVWVFTREWSNRC